MKKIFRILKFGLYSREFQKATKMNYETKHCNIKMCDFRRWKLRLTSATVRKVAFGWFQGVSSHQTLWWTFWNKHWGSVWKKRNCGLQSVWSWSLWLVLCFLWHRCASLRLAVTLWHCRSCVFFSFFCFEVDNVFFVKTRVVSLSILWDAQKCVKVSNSPEYQSLSE